MKKIKLKPCPFCGGKAEIRKANVYLDEAIVIRCTECLVRTQRVLINHPKMTWNGLDETTRYTEEQAKVISINAWNRRADSEQREAD